MAQPPPHFSCLLDGKPITIRPINEADADLEVTFIDRLSPTTKHYRFLGGVHHVSAELVKTFCNVDFDQTAALIATTEVDGEEREIGVVRYAPDSIDGVREMAITVADDWQNKGLGSLMAKRLIDFAKNHKVTKLYSIDLVDNLHMRQLATDLGMRSHRDPNDAHQVIYSLTLETEKENHS